jgi:2-polyprenyl-3-methyl-5-hydroxy-6-metoxy-1,4-benzoquinol methylase
LIKNIFKCRLCNSNKLKTVWKLRPSPIGDDYTKKKNKAKRFPLILKQCIECKFVQLSHYIDEKRVYGEYLYVTKTSVGLIKHFKENLKKNFLINKKINKVLDIGSNDGSNLKIYKQKNCKILGVEPAKKIAKIANKKKIPTLNFFFNINTTNKIIKKYGKFDLIMIYNLLANIENLDNMFQNISKLMHTKTIINVETFSLAGIIKDNLVDNIYHEHISYFHVNPFSLFLKKFNLEIINAEHNISKGGSLLFHITKIGSYKINQSNLSKCIMYEKSLNLNNGRVFNKIIKQNEKIKKSLHDLLSKVPKDKKIYGFGASCGTTTFLTYFDIAHYITCIFDDEKLRHGLYSPYYNIKVRKPKILKNSVLIFIAWRYTKNILKKHHNKFITTTLIKPLPNLKILK